MNILTVAVLLAMLATIASFVSGIASMAYDGEVAHRKSEDWMIWRVALQGATVLLLLLALTGW
jgi:hypothetical protein